MGIYDNDSVGKLLVEVLREVDASSARNLRSLDYLVTLPAGLVDALRAKTQDLP